MANTLPPGLAGYFQADELRRRNSLLDLQQQAGAVDLVNKLNMSPLQMEFLKAQAAKASAEAQAIPGNRQTQELLRMVQLRGLLDQQAERERQQGARSRLTEMLGRPTEEQGLAQVMEAERMGQPANVTTQNPNLIRSLAVEADPTGRLLRGLQPPQAAQTGLAKLIQERDALPPNDPRRAIYTQAIEKASTHQAPVNVYSGSLTPGVDAQGRPVYVQPSGRADVPPRVVEGVYPQERADQARQRQSEAEAQQTVASVRKRIESMSKLIQANPSAVGLAGGARQLGEMAAGVGESLGAPSIQTPALDFANEQALLLADVRKLIEKDPNLSKDERDRLYQTLGGSIRQTPSSALRALNNVLQYVEGKKATGESRERRIERRAPAVGTVEGDYRFKGGDPSSRDSWERVQ